MSSKTGISDTRFVPQNGYTILDSSLIVTTKNSLYDIKLVECGEYIQVYLYSNRNIKTNKKDIQDLELKKRKIDLNLEDNGKKDIELKSINEIEDKNIIRSKLECQRIAKCNIDSWETFITLTFANNINSVSFANKRFRYFIDKIKRVKKDFKYLCITEFQKRGAVHYHLLTNISISDKKLIYSQEDNPQFKHIKYWIDGFTSVEKMKGDTKKIIGYISKYMTKDIDNRLFNRHRYFYSRNLIKPIESLINLDKDNEFFIKKIQDKNLIYQNEYVNSYDNSKVTFLEYLKPN